MNLIKPLKGREDQNPWGFEFQHLEILGNKNPSTTTRMRIPQSLPGIYGIFST